MLSASAAMSGRMRDSGKAMQGVRIEMAHREGWCKVLGATHAVSPCLWGTWPEGPMGVQAGATPARAPPHAGSIIPRTIFSTCPRGSIRAAAIVALFDAPVTTTRVFLRNPA